MPQLRRRGLACCPAGLLAPITSRRYRMPHPTQDVLGNVTLQSFNASLARVQLASNLMARARQRAAALNASAAPLW